MKRPRKIMRNGQKRNIPPAPLPKKVKKKAQADKTSVKSPPAADKASVSAPKKEKAPQGGKKRAKDEQPSK